MLCVYTTNIKHLRKRFDPIVEQNGTFKQLDIYDILEREGLDHLADSIIYTNYYEVN